MRAHHMFQPESTRALGPFLFLGCSSEIFAPTLPFAMSGLPLFPQAKMGLY